MILVSIVENWNITSQGIISKRKHAWSENNNKNTIITVDKVVERLVGEVLVDYELLLLLQTEADDPDQAPVLQFRKGNNLVSQLV